MTEPPDPGTPDARLAETIRAQADVLRSLQDVLLARMAEASEFDAHWHADLYDDAKHELNNAIESLEIAARGLEEGNL